MAPETGLILRKPAAGAPSHTGAHDFPDPLPDPAPARAADAPEASEASASRPARRHRPWPVPRGRLAWLTGAISTLLLVASTLFWCLLLFPWPC